MKEKYGDKRDRFNDLFFTKIYVKNIDSENAVGVAGLRLRFPQRRFVVQVFVKNTSLHNLV